MFAVYQGEPGYFGSSLVADPARSAELIARLPFRITGRGSAGELEPWPPSSSIGIGAYERGALVIHQSLLDECMRADEHPIAKELLRMYPGETFVSFGLHSVVDYFGYNVLAQGKVRRFGGAEDHIDEDVGDLLPEEVSHFENSTVREGMRYFTSPAFPGEEFDAPAYGEELVMSITARPFGRPLNDFDRSTITVQYFPYEDRRHVVRAGTSYAIEGRLVGSRGSASLGECVAQA
ncbi:MAG TPA: hypothetical protein VF212_03595 [Longimicrobiales bacterium]